MRKRWIGLVLIIWALVLPSQVYGSGSGTTAASFLKIAVGARATAMGEAFSAVERHCLSGEGQQPWESIM